MSYQTAYTTHFRSLDNTLWDVAIYIDDYPDSPLEVKLEGDSPCVIEWQETGKTDVVQSSTCTLRVSNEKDRQMAQLMDHPDAAVLVSRNGSPYWFGHLDDAVYEEPYSFTEAYVTEITFSDFGILNRIPFTLSGKQSVADIVDDCLDSIGYGNGASVNLYTSLLEPKTQQPITLDMLYLNADRFASADGDSWGEMTMKRDVLEEILRPLGLRIMQKNGQVYIYDIEYLRDDIFPTYPTWKGTDACLRGSETFGWYEVAFEPDAVETLAEDGLDYDSRQWADTENMWALAYATDELDISITKVGFYFETRQLLDGATVSKSTKARFFKAVPVWTDSPKQGIAWRAVCRKLLYYINGTPIDAETAVVDNLPCTRAEDVEEVFRIETPYIPVTPDSDKFQMRVALDFLLDFKPDPFDTSTDGNTIWAYTPSGLWVWSNSTAHRCHTYMLPVLIELIDDAGNAIYHCVNGTLYIGSNSQCVEPWLQAQWRQGPGQFDGQYGMWLCYRSDDVDDDPVVHQGWATNRQWSLRGKLPNRTSGEYIPMPPAAGKVRFTVGNGILFTPYVDVLYQNLLNSWGPYFRWQLYRNPEITIVKANRRDDGIDTEAVYSRERPNHTADRFSETVKAGTWQKGVAPSARGLFFDASGNVWEQFVKNGSTRTLEMHRLRCIEDQTVNAQPVISGTAELNPVFCAYKEWCTPGIFFVTALRQDLHQDLEELTMARIANEGGFVYEFAWSDPVCAKVEPPFTYAWSDPVCAKTKE